jgi:hypothetical protein
MDELDYYRCHSPLTDPGSARHLLRGLPSDAAGMGEVLGGVIGFLSWISGRGGNGTPAEQGRDSRSAAKAGGRSPGCLRNVH